MICWERTSPATIWFHHGYSAAFADTAAALIAGHQRDLLQTGQTTIEHIILMEADMLDERGALGIVWDAMAEGSKTDQSYLWTLERFKTRKLYRRPERNPMYTELARAFWAEKAEAAHEFRAGARARSGTDGQLKKTKALSLQFPGKDNAFFRLLFGRKQRPFLIDQHDKPVLRPSIGRAGFAEVGLALLFSGHWLSGTTEETLPSKALSSTSPGNSSPVVQ